MTLKMAKKNTRNRRFAVLRKLVRIMRVVTSGDYCITDIAIKTGYDRTLVGRYLNIMAEEIPELKVDIVHHGSKHKKYYRWVA